jgi:hypothetical protein
MNSLAKLAGFALPLALVGMAMCPRAQAQSQRLYRGAGYCCTDR